jgi:hypothetical protein
MKMKLFCSAIVASSIISTSAFAGCTEEMCFVPGVPSSCVCVDAMTKDQKSQLLFAKEAVDNKINPR